MKINSPTGPGDVPFIWFGDAEFADKLALDQPLYCIPSGRIKIEQTETFIHALAPHCVGEILAIQPGGPYLMGGFCFDAWITYEVPSDHFLAAILLILTHLGNEGRMKIPMG